MYLEDVMNFMVREVEVAANRARRACRVASRTRACVRVRVCVVGGEGGGQQ